MGCDIHAYLEYYDSTHGSISNTTGRCDFDVQCYASDICFWRNYSLFNLLAGVRGIGGPVFNVRGIPSSPKLSFHVAFKYHEKNGAEKFEPNPNWHTPGYLFKNELIEIRRRYLIETMEYESTEYKGTKRKTALSTLKNSNEVELMKCVFPSIECVPLNATISSMIAIENSGNYQSRFVFWFDS